MPQAEEQKTEETEPGTTWQNPGEFPEYNPDQSEEDKQYEAQLNKCAARVEELRKKGAEVPEGKFRFPDGVYEQILQEIESGRKNHSETSRKHILFSIEAHLSILEELTGEIDQEVGEKLWELYDDPEISVGAHGTDGGRDTNFGKENGPFMTYGIGCPYKDVRRTVSFQDRGRIHAHGELSFLDLLSYSFGGEETTRELDIESGELYLTGEKIPASQYTVIVAIPHEFSTYDNPDLLTEERIPVLVKHHVPGGARKMARAIKPEFIVGIMQDGRVNDVVWNPKFSADHVRDLSRKQKVINEEKARVREEQLRLEEERRAAEKEAESKKFGARLKKMFRKLGGKA